MLIKKGLFYLMLASLFFLPAYSVFSQYINLSGNNPYIRQYVEESDFNWDKSIIYVFYSNQVCDDCAEAMSMIYDLYENNYADQFSLFEINYQDSGENAYKAAYNLTQPLSIVLVKINDGFARGYYKIDNPQMWINNPGLFNRNITSQINNFLGQ